jgi:hypothetical protein
MDSGTPRFSQQTARREAGTPPAWFQLHTLRTGANNQTVINIMKTIFALLSVLILVLLTGCADVQDESYTPAASNTPATTSNPAVTNTPATTNPNL